MEKENPKKQNSAYQPDQSNTDKTVARSGPSRDLVSEGEGRLPRLSHTAWSRSQLCRLLRQQLWSSRLTRMLGSSSVKWGDGLSHHLPIRAVIKLELRHQQHFEQCLARCKLYH